MPETVKVNKRVLRRWIEIANEGAFDKLGEVFATDVVVHAGTGLGTANGVEEMGSIFAPLATGFPGLRLTLEDLIGEGDKVVSRVTARGTHTGEFFGAPPQGKAIEIALFGIYRFENEKIVEMWGVDDILSLLEQIGRLPLES